LICLKNALEEETPDAELPREMIGLASQHLRSRGEGLRGTAYGENGSDDLCSATASANDLGDREQRG
jgi:hypothetical protein